MVWVNYLQSAAVSCAIMSSSLVGMTQTVTLESGVEMMASSPRVLFFSGIDLDAKVLETLADGGTHRCGVLADTGRKDEAVEAAEHGGVGADVLA